MVAPLRTRAIVLVPKADSVRGRVILIVEPDGPVAPVRQLGAAGVGQTVLLVWSVDAPVGHDKPPVCLCEAGSSQKSGEDMS